MSKHPTSSEAQYGTFGTTTVSTPSPHKSHESTLPFTGMALWPVLALAVILIAVGLAVRIKTRHKAGLD